MNPAQLVNANVSLQKLNQGIDDLVFLEGAHKFENVVEFLTREEKTEALEVLRAIGVRSRTADIKALKERLVEAGIEIDGDYIEKRLKQCRESRDASHAKHAERAANVQTLHTKSQWGPGSRDKVN